MKLEALLEDVDVLRIAGDASVEISAVSADSRQCGAGSLFVAVPGFVHDGARFIRDAIDRGASAFVSQGEAVEGVTHIEVEDARTALAVIAANFHGRPATRLSLIGVTGTSGKTTTTKMIESIIEATGTPPGLIGTIEYRAGRVRELADRTTPDAVVLQQWLARMVDESVRYAVMEVSSHALALRRTHGLTFAAAVFTNLSRDHFDFHRDFEDYFGAKKMLFDQIDRSQRVAVVNIDDAHGVRLASELGDAVLSFGMEEGADIHPAPGFSIGIDGLHGTLATPAGECRVDSPLIGAPNLSNWMAAVGASLAAGIGIAAIEKGIAALSAVRGRFERVPSDNGVVLVDYAHKPDALEKLLRAVRDLAPGRSITLVFGCGGDRDQGKRALMGEMAAEFADQIILTSDNPRSEDPESILDQIEEGVRRTEGARCVRIQDRRAAIEEAIASAGDDTVVVIAGKGHENYQVVGDQIIHFDDREEAELALKKKNTRIEI